MATLTLRPNADGTYHTWNEVPNTGVTFANQFEEGNFSAWTGTSDPNNRLSVQSTTKHHGTYAAKITSAPSGESPYVYKTGLTGIVNARMYVRFETLPDASGDWISIMMIHQNGNLFGTVLFVKHDGTSPKWWLKNYGFGGTSYGTTTVSTNTWYSIEVERGASNQKAYIYDNSGTLIETITVAQAPYNTADALRAGASTTSDGFGVYGFIATLEFDCVVVATSYIGVESRKDLVDDESDNTAVSITSYAGEDVDVLTRKTVYNLADHTTETEAITDVTAYCRAKYSAGGGNEGFKLIWKLAATEVQSVEKTPTNAYAEYSDSRATDPDGGAWSWTDIDSLEIGAIPSALANAETIDVSEFWIVVTYTVGGATYTVTYATDTLFKKLGLTKDYSVDVLLQKLGITQTYTVDSLLKKLNLTKDYSVDTILKKFGITKDYSINVLFKKLGITTQYTIDVLLKKLGLTTTYTIDAIFKAILTQTYTLDSLFKKSNLTKTYTIDSIFGEVTVTTYTKTYSIDTVFKYKIRLPTPLGITLDGQLVIPLKRDVWISD